MPRLLIDNLNVLFVIGVIDEIDDTEYTDATLEATIYSDSDYSIPVSGYEDLPLVYVTGSTADYYAQFECGLPIVDGETYYIEVVGVGDWEGLFKLRGTADAAYRGFSR